MFFSTLAAMPLCHPAYPCARSAIVRCGCVCLVQTIRGSLNPLLFQLFIGVTLCRFLVRVKRDFMVASGSLCAGPSNHFSLGSKSILKGFLSFSPAVGRGSGQFLAVKPFLGLLQDHILGCEGTVYLPTPGCQCCTGSSIFAIGIKLLSDHRGGLDFGIPFCFLLRWCSLLFDFIIANSRLCFY